MLASWSTERIDPVLFGYSYDYVGDLAETISLVWPDPAGRQRRTAADAWRRGRERCRRASRSEGRRFLRACSTAPSIAARFALIKLVTGGLRIGVSARLAKQALADFGERRGRRDRGSLARADAALRDAVRLARRRGAEARQRGQRALPARDAVATRSRTATSNARPGRLRGRMEVGRHPRAGGRRKAASGGSIRAPATTSPAPFPTSWTRWISTAALDGELLVGAPGGRDRHLLRPAAAAEPQDGLAEDARAYPAFMRCYDLLHARRRGPAAAALRRAARAARSLRARRSIPPRFDLSPLVAFDDWDELDEHAQERRRIRSSRA